MHYLADFLVLIVYFVLIMSIGIRQRSKSQSVAGFALADRGMTWWAVLASILAAEISAATFLGAPESGYSRHNWTYAQFAIGTIMARIIVSYLFIPIFYKQGVISLYEYLETRFGLLTRKFASATFLVTRVLAMGTRLYVAAIVLVLAVQAVQGQPVSADTKFWLFTGAVIFITVMTCIYTAVGGIRAVIWTDFIQITVLFSAVVFTVIFLLYKIPGGWSTVTTHIQEPYFWNFAKPPTGETGFWPWLRNVLTSEYTIWAAFIGSTFVTMATHGIDQDTVQRMLSAKNRRQSAFATILSGLIDLPVVSAFILIGIMLFAYYQAFPNPGLPGENREVFPFFILHEMPMGLRGLVIAGIIATAMGSLSTALNALGTSFAGDFVFPRMKASATEAQRVAVLRWSTVFFALLIIVVGIATAYYMAHHPKAEIIPLVLGILGFTFGSLLGIFLLAVLTKTRGNDLGNIIGMLCGMVSVLFLSNVLNVQPRLGFTTDAGLPYLVLSFPWRITLGTLVTILVASLFKTPLSKVESARKLQVRLDAEDS
jgi:SSS family solute:Na+ symporter